MPFVIAGIVLLSFGAFSGCNNRTDRGAPVTRHEAVMKFAEYDNLLAQHKAAIEALDAEVYKLQRRKK